jgi:hypothetical protein
VSPKSSRSEGMVRVDVDASAENLATGNGDVLRANDAAFPLAYGSDTLELMVRDPTWAHAYWDMSVERLDAAVGPFGRAEGFLRLIGVPTGHLLDEHVVWARRGSLGLALPRADSSYMVELAIMRDDFRWVILARSGVVHAPPTVPRVATSAGVALGPAGEVGHLVSTRTPGSSYGTPRDRR